MPQLLSRFQRCLDRVAADRTQDFAGQRLIDNQRSKDSAGRWSRSRRGR
jgi:hypothetical protein